MSAPAPILLPVQYGTDPLLGYTNGTMTGVGYGLQTFDPESKKLGVARYVDRSGGISIGYPSITLSVRPPVKGSRMYKVTTVLTQPTLEQTSASTSSGIQPQPTVAYSIQGRAEIMIPERCTLNERKQFRRTWVAMFLATIAEIDGTPSVSSATPLIDAIENFEDVWG